MTTVPAGTKRLSVPGLLRSAQAYTVGLAVLAVGLVLALLTDRFLPRR